MRATLTRSISGTSGPIASILLPLKDRRLQPFVLCETLEPSDNQRLTGKGYITSLTIIAGLQSLKSVTGERYAVSEFRRGGGPGLLVRVYRDCRGARLPD
jgi:hypothetical protein